MTTIPNSPHARDIAALLHPQTNTGEHEQVGPLILDEGKGIYVKDLEGKEYLEGMAGLWCTSLGFSNERLVDAAIAQMRKLPTYHTFFGRSNMAAIELAEKLLSIAPVPMSKVWFANSGSEANDHMVKFVWYYNNACGRPEKKKILGRLEGFHGTAVSSGSLTGLTRTHKDFDLPIARFLHTGSHHYYGHARNGESEEAFATRRAEELEQLILDEGPETIAAFVAEPVMGAGGCVVPPPGYIRRMWEVLQKNDIVFAISASGNSPNVVKAIEYANSAGAITIGLSGFNGGIMKSICQTCIHINTDVGEYELVEDVHHAICHMLSTYIKEL